MIQTPFWAGQEQDFCMMCVMQSHIVKTLSNTGNVIKPMGVINNLRHIAKHFRLGSQEDAHEFLRYIIDEMQRSCLNGYFSYGITPEASFIQHVFGGCLRSRIKCQKCKSVSDKYEDYLDLALEIKSTHSISHALEEFVKVEQLEGDNAYKCSKCNQLVSASKTLSLHRTSNVLTLSLKRFASFSGGKLSKDIKYAEYIDISPYTSYPNGQPHMYKLYAVLVHSGTSCHTGHYYSYIKASNDQWYVMNDSIVSRADIKAVLNQQAYLLFYVRAQNVASSEPSYALQSASPNSPQPSCSQRASVSKFSFIGPQQMMKNVKHMNGNRSPKCSVNGPVLNNNFNIVKRPMGSVPVNRQVSINSTIKKQKITITINKQHPVQGPSLYDAPKTESATSANLTSINTTKPCPTSSTSSVPTQSESKHAPIRLNRGTLVNGKSKVTPNLLVPYGTESSEESEEEQKGIPKRRWSGKCADGAVTANRHSTPLDTLDRTDGLKEDSMTPLESSPTTQNELTNGTFESSMSNSHNGEKQVESNSSVSVCELPKNTESSSILTAEDTEESKEQRPRLQSEKPVTKPELPPNTEIHTFTDSESSSDHKSLLSSSGSSQDLKSNSDRSSQKSKSDRYRSSDKEFRHTDSFSSGHYKEHDRQHSRNRGRNDDRSSYYHSRKDHSRSREKHRRHHSPSRGHQAHYSRDHWVGKNYKQGWSQYRYFRYNNHHSNFYGPSYQHNKVSNYISYQDYGHCKKRKYHPDVGSAEDEYKHGFKRQANPNRCPADWPQDQ
ncbi:ubiquitin carboxyl-terminal hydrolase 42 isoform 2-T3 [Mantella aurantiaca]